MINIIITIIIIIYTIIFINVIILIIVIIIICPCMKVFLFGRVDDCLESAVWIQNMSFF